MSARRLMFVCAMVCAVSSVRPVSVPAEESRPAVREAGAPREESPTEDVRIRMSDLKKKNPELYEQFMRMINADRAKRLEELRVTDPEKYRAEIKARHARKRKHREQKLKEKARTSADNRERPGGAPENE